MTAAEANGTAGRLYTLRAPSLPPKAVAARQVQGISSGAGWRPGETVFVLVSGDWDEAQGSARRKLAGAVRGNARDGWTVDWERIRSRQPPTLVRESNGRVGVYANYTGASLTAYAFDRVTPGLGKWLVVLASWLFALSTMISWSYYGEQGIVYLSGKRWVLPYKVVYCGLVVATTLGFITTGSQLDAWTTLGLGVMLMVNIPLMVVFGPEAMRAYYRYLRRLDRGEFPVRRPRAVTDVSEGRGPDE